MARETTIKLGGQDRPLKFRCTGDRVELCKRFPGRSFHDLMFKGLMGLTGVARKDDTGEVLRDDKGRPLAETDAALLDLEVLVAFLARGLRVPEAQVYEWLDVLIGEGGRWLDLYGPVSSAVLASGMLGYSVDTEAEPSEQGKAEEAPKSVTVQAANY